MARCSACDYPLPDDRERFGARCPKCFVPLYEAVRLPRPVVRAGDRGCAKHPNSELVGVCARCNARVCEVCRTRWNDRVNCPPCIERDLDAQKKEAEARGQKRPEASYSVQLTAAAWSIGLLSVLTVWLLGAWKGPGEVSSALLLLLLALLMLGGLAALAGVGLAVSVLRRAGDRPRLATLGLALGGLYVGVLLGVFTMGVWSY
jgi:hypothetical protein